LLLEGDGGGTAGARGARGAAGARGARAGATEFKFKLELLEWVVTLYAWDGRTRENLDP
jgi:hypothetical protein